MKLLEILGLIFCGFQKPKRQWLVFWYEPREFGHIEHGQLLISADTDDEAREDFSKQFPRCKISGVMEVE